MAHRRAKPLEMLEVEEGRVEEGWGWREEGREEATVPLLWAVAGCRHRTSEGSGGDRRGAGRGALVWRRLAARVAPWGALGGGLSPKLLEILHSDDK